jgi:hypothetical protein
LNLILCQMTVLRNKEFFQNLKHIEDYLLVS